MDVSITVEGSKVYLSSPYNPDMPPKAREIGGRWDASRKAWGFDARDEQRVRELAREFYGTDGSEPAGDVVTVRMRLIQHIDRNRYGSDAPTASFAGRRIAERPHRDAPVRLMPGVVLVAGELHGRGGSMRYPEIDPSDEVIVEVRDVPRAALSIEEDYEIVDDQPAPVDVEALLAERERLLARIAEIDAQLPEPEGVEMTTRQAAQALGVSVRTVQRWAQRGTVTASKDGHGHWTITITVKEN